jgi:hypothetical protein
VIIRRLRVLLDRSTRPNHQVRKASVVDLPPDALIELVASVFDSSVMPTQDAKLDEVAACAVPAAGHPLPLRERAHAACAQCIDQYALA